MIGRYLVRRRVADLASRALAPHALLARQAVESGGFTVGAGEAMSKHWSGVEMGHYFEVVINDYDPNIHTESSVTVPFYRSEPVGLSTCMLEAVEFTVKSVAADSSYHVTKAIRNRVAPPLKRVPEAPGSCKKFSCVPMTSFFSALPSIPKPAKLPKGVPPTIDVTETPPVCKIALATTPSDNVGDIAGGAATWDPKAGRLVSA